MDITGNPKEATFTYVNPTKLQPKPQPQKKKEDDDECCAWFLIWCICFNSTPNTSDRSADCCGSCDGCGDCGDDDD